MEAHPIRTFDKENYLSGPIPFARQQEQEKCTKLEGPPYGMGLLPYL